MSFHDVFAPLIRAASDNYKKFNYTATLAADVPIATKAFLSAQRTLARSAVKVRFTVSMHLVSNKLYEDEGTFTPTLEAT